MSAQRPIYVFDHVRSNSQLFNKLFAVHPQLEQIFMPLIGASLYGPEAVWRGRKHQEDTGEAFSSMAGSSGIGDSESYSVAVERIEESTARIQDKGKIPWLKDHAFCTIPRNVQDIWTAENSFPDELQRNPTVFKTEFLDSLTPVFLIRHPALSIPSFLRMDQKICKNRADDEDFAIYVALFWSRVIFDSFIVRAGGRLPANSDQVPIVVDAADLIYKTESTLNTLCDRLRIDRAGVQTSWTPVPEVEQPPDPIMRHFFAALYKSAGLERRAARPSEDDIDLDALQGSWSEEFGSEQAQSLRGLVDKEIEHYEYLKMFKLQV